MLALIMQDKNKRIQVGKHSLIDVWLEIKSHSLVQKTESDSYEQNLSFDSNESLYPSYKWRQ